MDNHAPVKRVAGGSPGAATTNIGDGDDSPVALSVRDFARRYGISERTARALVHAGHVRAFRVGRRLLRIPIAECDAYARRCIERGV